MVTQAKNREYAGIVSDNSFCLPFAAASPAPAFCFPADRHHLEDCDLRIRISLRVSWAWTGTDQRCSQRAPRLQPSQLSGEVYIQAFLSGIWNKKRSGSFRAFLPLTDSSPEHVKRSVTSFLTDNHWFEQHVQVFGNGAKIFDLSFVLIDEWIKWQTVSGRHVIRLVPGTTMQEWFGMLLNTILEYQWSKPAPSRSWETLWLGNEKQTLKMQWEWQVLQDHTKLSITTWPYHKENHSHLNEEIEICLYR